MRILITLTLCMLVAGVAVAGPADDGRALLEKGEVDAAIALLEKAAKADEESIEVALALGEAYLAGGRADEAITAATDATYIDIESAAAWLLRGKAYALKAEQLKTANAAGRDIRLCFADAKAGAEKALELDPKIAGAHIVKAQAAIGEFDTELAMAELRKEMEVDPKGAEAPMLLGNLLFNKKDYAGAAAAYKKSVENDPTVALTWRWLGASLARAKDRAGAILAYFEAAKLTPTMHSALSDLYSASVGYDKNAPDYECAIDHLRKLVDAIGGVKDAQAGPAARFLVWTLSAATKHEEALALIDTLIRTYPKDHNNYARKADVLDAMGKPDESLEVLKKAVLLEPTNNRNYNRLHNVALGMVRRDMRQAIELLVYLFGCRESADVANDLGFTHREGTKNYKKSLKWYLKASNLAPRNVDILNDTGLMYQYPQYHINQPEKAMKFYEKVLEIGRSDHAEAIAAGKPPRGYGDALENMALIYEARKQYKKAHEVLDELLGYYPGRRPGQDVKNRIPGK